MDVWHHGKMIFRRADGRGMKPHLVSASKKRPDNLYLVGVIPGSDKKNPHQLKG
jgi:hypothetical protein